MSQTIDKILNGKIIISQLKNGFRYGFDAVFLAAFVNGFLKKQKKKKFILADVGSGVGTISLIIAYKNAQVKLFALENNIEYLKIARNNILKNNFQKKITPLNCNILSLDQFLTNKFDIVVSNPPFYKHSLNISKNELNYYAKSIIDYKKWIINSIKYRISILYLQ